MSQKGLAPIAVLIIIAILAIVGIATYRNQSIKQSSENETESTTETVSPSRSPTPTTSPKPAPSVTKSPSPSSSPTSSPTPTTSSQISCEITTSPSEGWAPLTVNLSQNIKSPTGASGLQWDYDGDGKWDTEMVLSNYSPQYTYQKAGSYNVKLNVKTSQGDTSCTKSITVKPAGVECKVNADKSSGKAPFAVNFTYEASFHGNVGGDTVDSGQWDFDGNGTWDTPFDSASLKSSYTYSKSGNYIAKLQLRTKNGLTSEVCTGNISVE